MCKVQILLQGHPKLVEEVIKISCDFIKQNVLEWIVSQGGWVSDYDLISFSNSKKFLVTKSDSFRLSAKSNQQS